MANTKPLASQIKYGNGTTVANALSKSVLSYQNYESASAAAATLPDGQEIEAPNSDGRLSRFAVQSSALVFKDYAPDAIHMQSYAGLRAYSGKHLAVDITSQGFAGRFNCRGLVVGATDNGGTCIIDTIGRLWERAFSGEGQASWWGVSTANEDNAPAIMAALAAMNPVPVRLPGGIINTGKITFNSFDALIGQGSEATTLRLKNGANSDLLYAANSDALWGTNSTDCVVAPRLEGFTLVGNRANNTAGRCLAMYAERPFVHDLVITDAPDDGMRTEWSSSASESQDGLEGRFTKLTIMRNGGHGWPA